MVKPKGGPRKGAGREPKLSFEQKLWIKRRYEKLMYERAKERAIRQSLLKENVRGEEGYIDDEDLYKELKEYQAELKALPISERMSQHAKDLQSASAELIGKRRYVKVGSGRGPLTQNGGNEKTSEHILQQVADEANKRWGRSDITSRTVRTACAEKFSDEDIVKNFLDKNGEQSE